LACVRTLRPAAIIPLPVARPGDGGDNKTKVIALYQVKDAKFKYMGVAPEK
jgi:hypothetical protein